MSGVLVLYSLSVVAGLATAPLIGTLVAAAGERRAGTPLHLIVGACVALLVVQTVLTLQARVRCRKLGEIVLASLREDFVADALAVPLAQMEAAGTGDLLTRTTRDVAALSRTIRFTVMEVVGALLTMLLTLVALALVSPLLAIPALLLMPVVWLVTRWYVRRAPAGYHQESAAHADVGDGLAETVTGWRTVAALGRGAARVTRTDEDIRRVYTANRYTLNLRSVWLPSVGIACLLPFPAVLFTGTLLYSAGLMGLTAVTAATLYAYQLAEPVNRLSYYIDDLHLGLTALSRILGLAATRPVPASAGPPPEDADLALIGVRYSYDGREALRGIDLTVRAGERLAVVGPSGAGKTTLGKVLAGLYQPDQGTVTVGGQFLACLDPAALRRCVAMVTQEHHVFTGTVLDNLTLAALGATENQVRAALASVDATRWVDRLPDGLATTVGLGGMNLTPDQVQQLSMARVILADPRIILLDEATAALGLQSARTLELAVAAATAGRTVISIAHRLHTAHDADRVAVMHTGRITELGTHDELLAANGTYAQLWRIWHRSATASPP